MGIGLGLDRVKLDQVPTKQIPTSCSIYTYLRDVGICCVYVQSN